MEHINGEKVILEGRCCSLRVSFVEANIIRLHALLNGHEPAVYDSTVVPVSPVDCSSEVFEDASGWVMQNGDIKAVVDKDPMQIRVYRNEKLIFSSTSTPFSEFEPGKIAFKGVLFPDERIYGLGQSANEVLNIRDKLREMWQQRDIVDFCASCGSPMMYSSIPYGLLLNTNWPSRFVLGEAQPTLKSPDLKPESPWQRKEPAQNDSKDEFSILLETGEMDMFLMCADNYAGIMNSFGRLAGYAPMLPRWAYGLLQCKFGYFTEEELLHTAQRFRKEQIPLDAMILDIVTYERLGDLELIKEFWPDPKGMIAVLNSLGIQLIGGQHPYIDESSLCFEHFLENGDLLKVKKDQDLSKSNFGAVALYNYVFDYSNPEARKHWWAKIREQFEAGTRGWWTDMSDTFPFSTENPCYLGNGIELHNVLGTEWARALYEGQRADYNERLIDITGTQYAGAHRYGAVGWTNDISSTFELLKKHVIVGQQISMSGTPYWCTDTGGYELPKGAAANPSTFSEEGVTVPDVPSDPEVFIRWLQWSLFAPIFRIHAQHDNEPWTWGKYYQSIIADTIRMRYRLLPYIYDNAYQTHSEGIPIVRSMAASFPEDMTAVSQEHQFMFGDSLLVVPVLEAGIHEQEIYLPAGDWYDFYTKEKYAGSRTYVVKTPLDHINVFVKAGSVIPMAPEHLLTTRDYQSGEVEYHIHPGKSFVYRTYEDDGRTFDYESGAFAQQTLTYDDDVCRVTLSPVSGSYKKIVDKRTVKFCVYHMDPDVTLDGADGAKTSYCEQTRCLTVAIDEYDITKTVELQFAKADALAVKPRPSVESYPVDNGNGYTLLVTTALDGEELLCKKVVGVRPARGFRVCGHNTSITKCGKTFVRVDEIEVRSNMQEFTQDAVFAVTVDDEEIRRLSLGSGHVTTWKMIGPYEGDRECFHMVFEPEETLQISEAMANGKIIIKTPSQIGNIGLMNLNAIFGIPRRTLSHLESLESVTHYTGYASCVINAPYDMSTTFFVKADDRVKVWCNGMLVALADSNYTADQQFSVKLRKGANDIFLKCSQFLPHPWKLLTDRAWGFNLKIVEKAKNTTENLTVCVE